MKEVRSCQGGGTELSSVASLISEDLITASKGQAKKLDAGLGMASRLPPLGNLLNFDTSALNKQFVDASERVEVKLP